jgi:GGDEF domain-containing protein
VILPGTGSEQAAEVLERIRATVREEFAADAVPLTVSSGIASSARGEAQSLVRAAYIAMDEAKANGKDRTVVHGAAGAADRGGAAV